MAADASEHALQSLEESDLKDYLDNVIPDDGGVFGIARMGLETLLSSFGLVLGVGAAGVKQIGLLIDR